MVYEDFWEVFKRLLFRIHTTDPETVELSDSELLAAFNDPETSNSIVVYLRLVVSAYLKVSRTFHTIDQYQIESVERA